MTGPSESSPDSQLNVTALLREITLEHSNRVATETSEVRTRTTENQLATEIQQSDGQASECLESGSVGGYDSGFTHSEQKKSLTFREYPSRWRSSRTTST